MHHFDRGGCFPTAYLVQRVDKKVHRICLRMVEINTHVISNVQVSIMFKNDWLLFAEFFLSDRALASGGRHDPRLAIGTDQTDKCFMFVNLCGTWEPGFNQIANDDQIVPTILNGSRTSHMEPI